MDLISLLYIFSCHSKHCNAIDLSLKTINIFERISDKRIFSFLAKKKLRAIAFCSVDRHLEREERNQFHEIP